MERGLGAIAVVRVQSPAPHGPPKHLRVQHGTLRPPPRSGMRCGGRDHSGWQGFGGGMRKRGAQGEVRAAERSGGCRTGQEKARFHLSEGEVQSDE